MAWSLPGLLGHLWSLLPELATESTGAPWNRPPHWEEMWLPQWRRWKIKKIIVLKWHLLLFCASDDNFLIELRCAMKSGFYTTTSDDQVSGWTEMPKHFSKPNLYQKRSKWVSGGLLSLDPLQLSESQWNHYIWEVCSANWWHAANACSRSWSMEGSNSPWQCPLHVAQPGFQKLSDLGYEVLPHTPHSPDLLPTDHHFFKHLDNFFCRENTSTTSRRQKMLSKSSLNPEEQIFMLQE